MISVCHATYQEIMTKEWKLFRISHYPTEFGGRGFFSIGDLMILI